MMAHFLIIFISIFFYETPSHGEGLSSLAKNIRDKVAKCFLRSINHPDAKSDKRLLGPSDVINRLASGEPHLLKLGLHDKSQYSDKKEKMYKLKNSVLGISISIDALLSLGISVDYDDTTEITESFKDHFGWITEATYSQLSEDERKILIDENKPTKEAWVDLYGGYGLGTSVGSGRAVVSGMFSIKGAGQTHISPRKQQGQFVGSNTHSLNVQSEVLKPLGIKHSSILGEVFTTVNDNRISAANESLRMTVRIAPNRIGHFMVPRSTWSSVSIEKKNSFVNATDCALARSLSYYYEDLDQHDHYLQSLTEEMAKNVAKLFSRGYVHKTPSASNLTLDGGFTDLESIQYGGLHLLFMGVTINSYSKKLSSDEINRLNKYGNVDLRPISRFIYSWTLNDFFVERSADYSEECIYKNFTDAFDLQLKKQVVVGLGFPLKAADDHRLLQVAGRFLDSLKKDQGFRPGILTRQLTCSVDDEPSCAMSEKAMKEMADLKKQDILKALKDNLSGNTESQIYELLRANRSGIVSFLFSHKNADDYLVGARERMLLESMDYGESFVDRTDRLNDFHGRIYRFNVLGGRTRFKLIIPLVGGKGGYIAFKGREIPLKKVQVKASGRPFVYQQGEDRDFAVFTVDFKDDELPGDINIEYKKPKN